MEILPVENVSQIDFVTPTYYSKDFREIGVLINNTSIFIGADSGIMHLASSSEVKTLGLFSVSDINKYHPYGNNSIAVQTESTGLDELINLIHRSLSTINPVTKDI